MFIFFQAEDGIRDGTVTGVQTCALPISIVPSIRCAKFCDAENQIANDHRANALQLKWLQLDYHFHFSHSAKKDRSNKDLKLINVIVSREFRLSIATDFFVSLAVLQRVIHREMHFAWCAM